MVQGTNELAKSTLREATETARRHSEAA